MPRCASVISPGRARGLPPPMSETADALWCGAAEGWIGAQRGASSAARGRVHLGDLERFVGEQRRHDRREAAGEHRLADAGRADEQRVMGAGGRDRQCVARGLEAAHVDEVEGLVGVGGVGRHRRRVGWIGPGRFAFQAGVELAEAAGDAHVGAGDERGFVRVGGGHDHVGHAGLRPACGRCRARRRPAGPGRRGRARRAPRRRRARRPGARRRRRGARARSRARGRRRILRTAAGARFTVTRVCG